MNGTKIEKIELPGQKIKPWLIVGCMSVGLIGLGLGLILMSSAKEMTKALKSKEFKTAVANIKDTSDLLTQLEDWTHKTTEQITALSDTHTLNKLFKGEEVGVDEVAWLFGEDACERLSTVVKELDREDDPRSNLDRLQTRLHAKLAPDAGTRNYSPD